MNSSKGLDRQAFNGSVCPSSYSILENVLSWFVHYRMDVAPLQRPSKMSALNLVQATT